MNRTVYIAIGKLWRALKLSKIWSFGIILFKTLGRGSRKNGSWFASERVTRRLNEQLFCEPRRVPVEQGVIKLGLVVQPALHPEGNTGTLSYGFPEVCPPLCFSNSRCDNKCPARKHLNVSLYLTDFGYLISIFTAEKNANVFPCLRLS